MPLKPHAPHDAKTSYAPEPALSPRYNPPALPPVAGMMTLPWANGGTLDVDSGKIYAVSYGSHGAQTVRISLINETRLDFSIDFDLFRVMLRLARAGEYVDYRNAADIFPVAVAARRAVSPDRDSPPKKKSSLLRFGIG